MEKVRLQKFLAQAGVASRRASERLIQEGKVWVNGKKITQLGTKIDPDNDIITVNGKRIKMSENKIYILLYKPSGYVTTVKDPQGRRTVMDLLKQVKERVFPVGRLDYDTEGLLILTNDGDFSYALTHPKFQIKKTYLAAVQGIPDKRDLQKLQRGVKLSDGPTAPAKVKLLRCLNGQAIIKLTIHEGRNRQVRRMLKAVGHPVVKLKRVAIGNLTLGKLSPGEYRYLEPGEVQKLLTLCKTGYK